jgi:hypothetical protein
MASRHFCPGISFADVMYFTLAIVQAFPRCMLVEYAGRSECLVGLRHPPGKAYEQFAALIIHKVNFLNVG